MEYTQITIDDWLAIKQELQRELNGVAESFVSIGYRLRQIEEGKLYEQDGYKNLATFAQAEYGLSASAVSRFVAINAKYSVGGYSPQLRPEFAGLGSSKLGEMLTLPDSDLELIRPETKREDIRNLKNFNNQEPEEGEGEELKEVIMEFYRESIDVLNDLYSSEAYRTGDMEEIIDIINPAGNRTYRKGKFYLFMYDAQQGIKIKEFGKGTQTLSWTAFLSITQDIFADAAAGVKTYETYFGEPQKKPEPEKPKEIVAPAQKKPENNKVPEKKASPQMEEKKEERETRSEEPQESPESKAEIEDAPVQQDENTVPDKDSAENEVINNPKIELLKQTDAITDKIKAAIEQEELQEASFYAKALMEAIKEARFG